MFEAIKTPLKRLLEDANDGRLQLPDFQRDYVWNDADVRSLIASVAKGFPVGALLTLQTGGEVRFKPRLLAGVPSRSSGAEPERLLLDGQQRITSLYQATFSKEAVRTRSPRGTGVDRFYYVDIKKAVNAGADIEESIIGMPANKILKKNFGRETVLDLSTRNKEFKKGMFPLNLIFDSFDWLHDWRDYRKKRGKDVSKLDKLERNFHKSVIKQIEHYQMPIIQLGNENGREAICLVFEKVNVGGKKLDTFELLTAIFAASDFDLRHDWSGSADKSYSGRKGRIIGDSPRRDVLTKVISTDFLQACTLLHTRECRRAAIDRGIEGRNLPQISCKRNALLSLPLDGYKSHADAVGEGFREAGIFLNEQKIISHKDIPYPPLIVGLASIFAILGKKAQNTAAKKKIARWFWSGVLGEMFGSSTETMLARDVPEVVDWITGEGRKPRTLDSAIFQRDRLISLRTRASAAYKGVHALLMRHGCRDFKTNRGTEIMTFFDHGIDIHHIFPQAWCKKQGISRDIFDSIVNKTPLSSSSNRSISGHAPSVYLRRIEEEQELSARQMDEILRSHLIKPEYLREDNFEDFFDHRMNALSKIIGKAMGKQVVAETGIDEAEHDIELEDEE